jgi:hypothetical protein
MVRSLSLAMDPGLRQDDGQRMKNIVRSLPLLVIPAKAGIHRRR